MPKRSSKTSSCSTTAALATTTRSELTLSASCSAASKAIPDDCPVCGAPLTPNSQIGPCCENDDCPVSDDCLLWYQNKVGEWKSQEWITGPWKEHPNGGKVATMTLSEKEYD